MGDSLITIVAIVLAAILMFVFPLMAMSDRTDDVSQLAVETATTDFVDTVRTTGKLSANNYSKFVESINSTGNAYDVEMEIKVLDENPGKKTSQATQDKIGENVYYSMYTSQILDQLEQGGNNAAIALKEGDMFSASVKNTNTTLSQQLKNFFYTVTGNETYTIAASHAGIVTTNGTATN